MFVFLQLLSVSYRIENNHIVFLRIDTYRIVRWPYRLIPKTDRRRCDPISIENGHFIPFLFASAHSCLFTENILKVWQRSKYHKRWAICNWHNVKHNFQNLSQSQDHLLGKAFRTIFKLYVLFLLYLVYSWYPILAFYYLNCIHLNDYMYTCVPTCLRNLFRPITLF